MEIRHLFSWLSNCSSCTKMFPGEVTCVTRTLMSLRQVGRLRLGFSSSEAGGEVGTTDRTSSSNGGSQTVISKGWVSLTWFLIKQEKMKKNGFYRLAWMSEQEEEEKETERKNEKHKESWSRCSFDLFYNLLFTGNSKAISDQYVSNTGSRKIVTDLIQTHGHRSSVGLWINMSDKQKCTVYHITLTIFFIENSY